LKLRSEGSILRAKFRIAWPFARTSDARKGAQQISSAKLVSGTQLSVFLLKIFLESRDGELGCAIRHLPGLRFELPDLPYPNGASLVKLQIFFDVDRSKFGSKGGGIGFGPLFGWLIFGHMIDPKLLLITF